MTLAGRVYCFCRALLWLSGAPQRSALDGVRTTAPGSALHTLLPISGALETQKQLSLKGDIVYSAQGERWKFPQIKNDKAQNVTSIRW